jgi:hypothetical protein
VSLTLSPTEVRELVGLGPRQPATVAEIERRLRQQGIPFREVDGRMLVSRAVAERWLAGVDTVAPRGVNLGAVR